MPISSGCVSTLRQSARDSAAGRMPSGSARQTPAAAASDSSATSAKAQRQPKVSPM